MKEATNEVGVDALKRYAAPEIEVIRLDKSPHILSASVTGSYKMGFDDIYETEWDE